MKPPVAAYKLVGTGTTEGIQPQHINLMGEFNIAGEAWMIRQYFEKIGIQVVATITGDGRVDDLRRCHGASLNLVQCSGSMTHLAKKLEQEHSIPLKRVSFFGFEDTAAALYTAAEHFSDDPIAERAQSSYVKKSLNLPQNSKATKNNSKGKSRTLRRRL